MTVPIRKKKRLTPSNDVIHTLAMREVQAQHNNNDGVQVHALHDHPAQRGQPEVVEQHAQCLALRRAWLGHKRRGKEKRKRDAQGDTQVDEQMRREGLAQGGVVHVHGDGRHKPDKRENAAHSGDDAQGGGVRGTDGGASGAGGVDKNGKAGEMPRGARDHAVAHIQHTHALGGPCVCGGDIVHTQRRPC